MKNQYRTALALLLLIPGIALAQEMDKSQFTGLLALHHKH